MEALHQPGDIIAERYRITDTLGQGGVGITYAAQDLKSGQPIALKVLSLRQMGDWKVLELFEREAQILAQLDHPAIPRYLDYFQVDTPEDRAFYIAQELAEGKSLAELAEIGWRTNESGVRRIATQLLEILIYLHSLKPPVVHRDIKPQNLIWGKDGKIFLVDFGAVQDTYRSMFAKGSTIVGTYGYMAPEQFRGQAVPATDLYGLGATVLFLLTHRSPSDLPQERLKISFRSRIQVSEGFAHWLEKMLEPDVDDRFPSAKEALEALQGRMIVAKPRPPVPWKALAGVAVAAVAAVTVLNSFKWAVLSTFGFRPSGICTQFSTGINIDIARNYLKQGGDINAKDAEYDVPVLPCLLRTDKDIAKLAIAKLSDVNVKDNEGMTPLHFADSKEVVELLISKGADINAKNNQGMTPLYLAITNPHTNRPVQLNNDNNLDLVKLLLAKGADVNAKDNQGQTALQAAIKKGQLDLAVPLIAKGAQISAEDANTRTKNGDTLLFKAARAGSKSAAELLISKGVQVNAKNILGEIPLHWAAAAGNSLIAKLSIATGVNINKVKNDEGRALQRWREENGRKDVAEFLIAKGAQVNAKDNYGSTPLDKAAATDSKNMAEFLIARGAQVNAKDNNGWTPLHSAAASGSKNVAELLIVKGAQVNAQENRGWTPLQLAISNECSCDRDMVKLLITKGANVNVKSIKGQGLSPLHLAAIYNWKDIAELLIFKGAQINAKNNEGQTPLQLAALYGRREVAELLIARGAQVNARTNRGSTPLQVAAAEGHREVAELLISHGAEVNAQRDNGMTPLHRAAAESHREVAELLIAIALLKSHGGTE